MDDKAIILLIKYYPEFFPDYIDLKEYSDVGKQHGKKLTKKRKSRRKKKN